MSLGQRGEEPSTDLIDSEIVARGEGNGHELDSSTALVFCFVAASDFCLVFCFLHLSYKAIS